MAKVKVKITKGRKFGDREYKVGDETSMDEAYFESSGNRFAEKIKENKEVSVEDEKPKKSKKKKNEDKELVAENK